MKNKTMEEYIETIFALQRKHGHAHTNDVASVLGVAPPSATEMLQKLAKEKLVRYVPYHGATLTERGERMAGDLIEKHRTLADFLMLIGVPREDAEIDACNIEHHVSRDTIVQFNKFLEFVGDAPEEQMWLANFRHFSDTGERRRCSNLKP